MRGAVRLSERLDFLYVNVARKGMYVRIDHPRHQRPASQVDDLACSEVRTPVGNFLDKAVADANEHVLRAAFICAVEDAGILEEDRRHDGCAIQAEARRSSSMAEAASVAMKVR